MVWRPSKDRMYYRKLEWERYIRELQSPPPRSRAREGQEYRVIETPDDPVVDGMIVEVRDGQDVEGGREEDR